MSKQMQIVTKAQADKILVGSLFKPVGGRTLNVERFDLGKYKPEGSYIGREVTTSDGVHAVYPVRRKDADGAYVALMCVTSA